MKQKAYSGAHTKGSSMPQKTSTGSGSRPTGGKIAIPSSNPSNAKKIRG